MLLLCSTRTNVSIEIKFIYLSLNLNRFVLLPLCHVTPAQSESHTIDTLRRNHLLFFVRTESGECLYQMKAVRVLLKNSPTLFLCGYALQIPVIFRFCNAIYSHLSRSSSINQFFRKFSESTRKINRRRHFSYSIFKIMRFFVREFVVAILVFLVLWSNLESLDDKPLPSPFQEFLLSVRMTQIWVQLHD